MRAVEFITEYKKSREEFEGITIEMVKNGHVLVINALDDWGNNILGSVAFNIGDDNDLDPQELKVDERYRGQGIARVMYDYAKSKGYEIHRSYDQTPAGAGFWNKHRGEDVRVWEQGVAEGLSEAREGAMREIIRKELPGWPDYVIKDWISSRIKNEEDLKNLQGWLGEINKMVRPNSWQLHQKMFLTFNMLNPRSRYFMKTKRKFGDRNPFMVPRDKERLEDAIKLVQAKGIENLPPVIMLQHANGLELCEGWHRTMAAFRLQPEGFYINVWIGQAGQQGVAEGQSSKPTMGINVRSDGDIDYASLIIDGQKKYESRKTDSLRPYVGKTVGIVRTGNGPAVAIGQVTIGEPIVVDAEKFNRLRKQHLVPQGSKFDIDSDGTKYLYPMIDPVRWDNEKLIKHKGIVSRKIEEDKSKDPIVNAVIDFYKHVGKIHKDPIDDYVSTAKEMLGHVSDPTLKSKLLDIFKQAKQNPYIQGGVVTTIGALLAGGVLSSAQKMGLSPSQTNLALQAILNTVIPTVVSRINGKSWSDTIKYTLASAGIGTGIAGMMEEDSLEEDWKSALATGAMAGAMAMGANAKVPNMVQQIVEPGDTVYSIARQNNVNPLEIYKLNKMDRSTKLEVGQKVLVPDYSKPISKMPTTVKPTIAQSTTSFKDKLTSMIPKFSRDKEEEEGVTLLSDNGDAEAALQTAAKDAGLKGAELAQFMAQTRHESWDFGKMKEVGNKKRFAKYETPRKAKQLGNKVKGDGERFKGRGFIQLTGRDNYTRASQQIFGDDRLVKNPDLASRLDIGAQIALWFWKNQVRPNVNNFNNTKEVTNAINPGLSGLQDRHNKFKEYMAVL